MTHAPKTLERAFCNPTVKAINDERKEVVHLISNASTDRAGDVVRPGGADVSNFLRNPVVLVDHDYRVEKIVGRAEAIEISDEGIFARTRFQTDTQLGKDAWSLVKSGMAKAWSIGFKPVEYKAMEDEEKRFKGFDFSKWELLEYSLVAIPMNPDAVTQAVQRGLIHDDTAKYLIRTSDVPPAQSARLGAKAEPEERSPLLDALREAQQRIERHHTAERVHEATHSRKADET